jgi:hypothetical protein
VLTVVVIALLLLHMQLVSAMARAAAEAELAGGELHDLRVQLVGDAGAAVAVLVAATALSIYKPRGLTRRGRRALRARQRAGVDGASA